MSCWEHLSAFKSIPAYFWSQLILERIQLTYYMVELLLDQIELSIGLDFYGL